VVTTVNQTSAAYWLGIVAAEKVFRIVPWGTHEFSMLVPPESLQDMLKEGWLLCTLVRCPTYGITWQGNYVNSYFNVIDNYYC
jgi:2-polyprenyl-3-methyl-5-hydroxy-6-metoxy-1,4-benzoquinol methylase